MPSENPTHSAYRTSLQIIRASTRTLKQYNGAFLIPVIASVTLIISVVVVLAAVFAVGIASGGEIHQIIASLYIGAFISAFLLYFVSRFFNAMLIVFVYQNLLGNAYSLRESFVYTKQHAKQLIVWSTREFFLTFILGLAYRLAGRGSAGVRILARFGIVTSGLAWNLATYFVTPIIVLENCTSAQSINRSATMVLKVWGEKVAGTSVFSLAFAPIVVCITVATFVALIIFEEIPMLIVVLPFILALIILAIIANVLHGVFRTILYRYANENVLPKQFGKELVHNAFTRK